MHRLSGSCACGHIQYTVEGPVLQVVACHCGMCRRMTGAPFSSYAVVKEGDLDVSSMEEALAGYAVTERTTRHFCRRCGTPVYNANPHSYQGLRMVYLGTVQDHEALAPGIAIYCESRLPWVRLPESVKSFAGTPKRQA